MEYYLLIRMVILNSGEDNGKMSKITKNRIGRKFKLKEIIFSHKPVDKAEDNPLLKSMKIVDLHLTKMRIKD